MIKIKVDKEKKQVIFQCKNEKKMKYTLEVYKKGCDQISKEARDSIK